MSTSPASIKVLCADDHALIREGIAALIANSPDMSFVGEAATGREAIEKFRELRPDVTLMDLSMPDLGGIEAIVAIRREFPTARVVVLTTFRGDVLAQRALRSGAQAYLLKSDVRKDLLQKIRDVHAGHVRVDPEVAFELAQHYDQDGLSAREVEVLAAIAAGKSNKAIGAGLSITEGTVKNHVKSILMKLHASDRTHAVVLGLERGIIGV